MAKGRATQKRLARARPANGSSAKTTKSPAAPKRLFKDQAAWATWLAKNHAKSSGLWLEIAKKNSGLKSASYAEALEVALCYGWIDGQKLPKDDSQLAATICSAF